MPAPQKKPKKCEKFKQELNEAISILEEANLKEATLLQELANLQEENNQIILEMQSSLGLRIAAEIINAPIKGLKNIIEILREILGGYVTDSILKTAQSLADRLTTVRQRIKYTQDQLSIANENTRKAQEDVNAKLAPYEKCLEKY